MILSSRYTLVFPPMTFNSLSSLFFSLLSPVAILGMPNKDTFKTPNELSESTLHECSQISSTTVGISLHGSAFFNRSFVKLSGFHQRTRLLEHFLFRKRCPTTISIIDAREVFIQIPSASCCNQQLGAITNTIIRCPNKKSKNERTRLKYAKI